MIRFQTSLKPGTFALRTLDDLDLPGFQLADPADYALSQRRAELVRFFFAQAERSAEGEAVLAFLDELEAGTVCSRDMPELLDSLKDLISAAFFGPRQDCRAAARAAVAELAMPVQDTAMVHVLIYSLLFRRPFSEFPQPVQQALLSRWTEAAAEETAASGGIGEEILLPAEGMEFRLSWRDLPAGGLTLRRLANPHRHKVPVRLDTPLGLRTLWVRAGGALNAWFVGDRLTCLKGSVGVRGDVALCWADQGGFWRLDTANGQCIRMLLPGKTPLDFAPWAYGGVMVVRDQRMLLPDGDMLEDVMGVFTYDDIWVALGLDGSTRSEEFQYCRDHVCAVVRTDTGLLVVDRENGPALEQQGIAAMLAAFVAEEGPVLEEYQTPAGKVRLTEEGRLV